MDTKLVAIASIVTSSFAFCASGCAHARKPAQAAPTAVSEQPLPKYGPNADPLSRGSHKAYFQKNDAPDFWALIPYYLPQETKTGCSAATFSMVLNAARKQHALTSSDPLVTFRSMSEKYGDESYRTGMLMTGKFDRSVVGWHHLKEVLETAVKKLGIAARVEKADVDLKDLESSRKAFHKALVENEKSADDFLVLAYMQGLVTGDPEGVVSHVVAVAAYDRVKKQVLLMDPDREWYEPYWAPEDKLFEAVADPRTDSSAPGWLRLVLR